jgi:hypothetical protein
VGDILLSFDPQSNTGTFLAEPTALAGPWQRLQSAALSLDPNAGLIPGRLTLAWYNCLNLFREFLPLQKPLGFMFHSDETSREALSRFLTELNETATAREGLLRQWTATEIEADIRTKGFTLRELRSFQLRDVAKLASLSAGANFSVPGAGKTTVALAIHLLTCLPEDKMLVICPKSAFPAWTEVVGDCITAEGGPYYSHGTFFNLSGLPRNTVAGVFATDQKYFVTNYEHFVALRDLFAFELATRQVHVVLDEAHRMKGGLLSQRGAALLSISNLPKRKDILTGTPMPQGASDLKSQLDFLWPGSSLGVRIVRGEAPRSVIAGLYSRTTKRELGLPPVTRQFVPVPMTGPQSALYGIVTNAVLQQLSSFNSANEFDVVRARRSVMRLLQLASNPLLAIRAITDEFALYEHGVIRALVEEPMSAKMRTTAELVRDNARAERKTVVWTIFTQNIIDLETELAELNPVSLYGAIPTGDPANEATREGRLRRFHDDPSCMTLIANPAAAGEGISLHEVCHEAIYLDRSYVSTHYLQSIDRIHRLGLAPDQTTTIRIVQATPPAGLGSIDHSVSRRLAIKIRALERLLEDPDLHEIALEEESAASNIEYNVEFDDVIDLIAELEGNVEFDENDAV